MQTFCPRHGVLGECGTLSRLIPVCSVDACLHMFWLKEERHAQSQKFLLTYFPCSQLVAARELAVRGKYTYVFVLCFLWPEVARATSSGIGYRSDD